MVDLIGSIRKLRLKTWKQFLLLSVLFLILAGCGGGIQPVTSGSSAGLNNAPPATISVTLTAEQAQLIALLASPDNKNRESAVDVISRNPDPVYVDALVAALNDTDDIVVGYDIDILTRIGEPAVDPLIRSLEIQNPKVMRSATQILAAIGDPRAIPYIFALVSNSDSDVQNSAIFALQLFGNQVVEPAIDQLKNDSAAIRAGSAAVLGTSRDNRSIDPLIEVLKDEDVNVRRAAAISLGLYTDPRIVEPLIALLNDPSAQVRAAAASSLQTADARAAEPLMQALQDPDAEVRAMAAQSLGHLADPRAIDPLLEAIKDENETVMTQAVNALLWYGEPIAERLNAALDDERGLKLLTIDYPFFFSKGVAGTKEIIIKALNDYGDVNMAEAFLNSGNQELADAADHWAGMNGYHIESKPLKPGESRQTWNGTP